MKSLGVAGLCNVVDILLDFLVLRAFFGGGR